MGLGLGIKSWVQFGREATWATAVAATHRLGFTNCTIEAKPQIARSANMPAGNTTIAQGQPWMRDPVNAGIIVVGEYAEGNLEMPLDYDGLLQFFDLMMGTSAFGTYGASVSGAGPYTHTFQPEQELLNSMTLQIYEGGINAANVAQCLGMKGASMTITGKAAPGDAGILMLNMGLIGQQKKINQAPTAALACIPRVPILFSHLNSFNDGTGSSATSILRGFEFSIKPELAAPEWQLGSAFIRQPVRKGLITTQLKLTREYANDDAIVAFKAGTIITGNPTLLFSSGSKQFQIMFNYAKIVEAPQPRPGLSGIMLQDITYECLWDPTGIGGCTITMVTAQNGAAA